MVQCILFDTKEFLMARLMNIEELADYLRLRRQTIYNWLHQGKIAGIKVGGVWRFDKRSVDAWLKSQQRKASRDFM
jgi:excisionase family DNA binding protein